MKNRLSKKLFILCLTIIIIVAIVLYVFINKPISIKHYGTKFVEYTNVFSSFLSLTQDSTISGDKINIKTKGKDKILYLNYEIYKNNELYETNKILEYPLKNNYNGDISVLLFNKTNNTDEKPMLFVDLDSTDGGTSKYINIPNIFNNIKGKSIESKDINIKIDYGVKKTIYRIIFQDKNGSYNYTLQVKMKIE